MRKLMGYEGTNGVRTFQSAEHSIGGQGFPRRGAYGPHSVRCLRKIRFAGNTPLRDKGVFEKISIVKFLISILSVVSVAALAADPVRLCAPSPEHADLEASAEAAAPGWFPTARTVAVTLSLDGAQGGGAEVALGRGQGGGLGLEGTTVILGWRDGEGWYVRGDRLRKKFAAQPGGPAPAGLRSLTACVRLDPGGAPSGITRLTADGAAVSFPGLDGATLLKWLDPGGWDTVKVTARGGAGAVSAEVRLYADGTLMILR